MLQQYLQSLDGMVTYQVISFALFLAVAIGVTIWVLRMKREHADRMARMPLDDQTLTHDSKTEVRS
jgi:cbb3-type cytochrome oxidase subunit 3